MESIDFANVIVISLGRGRGFAKSDCLCYITTEASRVIK